MSARRSGCIPISLAMVLVFHLVPNARGGHPELARYSYDHDAILWFIQIADIHVGEDVYGGTQDTDNLDWMTSIAYNTIMPEFIIAAGDLCDGTNGALIPSVQHVEEWLTYREILANNQMDPTSYHDVPGNHDAYGDPGFHYFLTYGMSGAAFGTTQHSWTVEKPFGTYHFMMINTASSDGLPCPFDNSGLAPGELREIDAGLDHNRDANQHFIFGHHPKENLFTGRDAFFAMLNTYKVSLYGFGHTHVHSCETPLETPWTIHLNTASLGKSATDHYQLIAIDNDAVVVGSKDVGAFPVVLITAPVPYQGCTGEEFRYKVPLHNSDNPVRALVFDIDQESIESVKFTIDSSTFNTMERIGESSVWEGFFDGFHYDYGVHSLTVRVRGSSTVSETVPIKLEQTECSDGIDNDGDGLIDSADGGCDDAFDDSERGYDETPTVHLRLNGTRFTAGDRFRLRFDVSNPGGELAAVQYVLLEIDGAFWSYPAWTAGVDGIPLRIAAGQGWSEYILDFIWPEDTGTGERLRFWAALIEPGANELIGSFDMVEWGYE
ncbi:metallophosphoesterase [bacterium]|nr:metallophosphoesterase [candidate division CSSED10-310 bacterium]